MGLFFNVKEPRKFNHRPIYFDPRKEALEERVEKVKKEMGISDESNYKPNIKGTFVEQTHHVRRRRQTPEKSNRSRIVKLTVLLVVLLIAFYWFYLR